MADRTLTKFVEQENEYGYHYEARIERLASGTPGILLIITDFYEGVERNESCVFIDDANEFLTPVIEWLGKA